MLLQNAHDEGDLLPESQALGQAVLELIIVHAEFLVNAWLLAFLLQCRSEQDLFEEKAYLERVLWFESKAIDCLLKFARGDVVAVLT